MKYTCLLLLTGVALGIASCSTQRQSFADGTTIKWSPKKSTALSTEQADIVVPNELMPQTPIRPVPVSHLEQKEEETPELTLTASTSNSPIEEVGNTRNNSVKTETISDFSFSAVQESDVKKLQPAFVSILPKTVAPPSSNGKSQLVALILCFLVGVIGIHRFYLGYTWQGIVQILTLGGLGIWTLIDLIRIIIGDLQPKDGQYEKTL